MKWFFLILQLSDLLASFLRFKRKKEITDKNKEEKKNSEEGGRPTWEE